MGALDEPPRPRLAGREQDRARRPSRRRLEGARAAPAGRRTANEAVLRLLAETARPAPPVAVRSFPATAGGIRSCAWPASRKPSPSAGSKERRAERRDRHRALPQAAARRAGARQGGPRLPPRGEPALDGGRDAGDPERQPPGRRRQITHDREIDYTLEENAEHLLSAIDAALQRIEEGTYGTCRTCGRKSAPSAWRRCRGTVQCIDCKRKEERG